jgi:hypothetical protein
MTTSIERLENSVQRQLGWRKKEMSNLFLLANTSSDDAQLIFIRSGILLTYAHLEGFVRESARKYLTMVQTEQLAYGQLAPSFLSLKVSRMVSDATTKASYYKEVVELLTNQLHNVAVLPLPEAISTHSNLNFQRFCEILYCINLDATPFELRKNFFDDVLLDKRNAIAHGEIRRVDMTDYAEIHQGVLEILEKLSSMLLQAAENRYFCRTA